MSIRINNRDAQEYVTRRQEFRGSNLWAEYQSTAYVVYSYGYHFPVCAFIRGKWYVNSDKYSSSTSAHQSACRPKVEAATITNLNTGDLKAKIHA